jgi:hypothetical protein
MAHRNLWAGLLIPLIAAGFAVGRFHLLAARPEVFAALGITAIGCAAGALHYGTKAAKEAGVETAVRKRARSTGNFIPS